MKIALILPGNLSCYFVGLNNFKYLIQNYDVDVYILYSQKINYIHTLKNFNENIIIDKDDINRIKIAFGDSIKYFNSIEEYPNFLEIQNQVISNFDKNISWIVNDENYSNQYLKFDTFEQKRKYLDQFLRSFLLYQEIEKYESKYNIKYDYIFRFRIDQFISKNLIDHIFQDLKIYDFISFSFMDNFYILKKGLFSFFSFLIQNIGNFKAEICHPLYKLGPEVQFQEGIKIFLKNQELNQPLKIKHVSFPFRVTFSIFDISDYFFYINKGTEPAGKIEHENKINEQNYKEKLKFLQEYKIIKNNNCNIPEKYHHLIIKFYSLHEIEINNI